MRRGFCPRRFYSAGSPAFVSAPALELVKQAAAASASSAMFSAIYKIKPYLTLNDREPRILFI